MEGWCAERGHLRSLVSWGDGHQQTVAPGNGFATDASYRKKARASYAPEALNAEEPLAALHAQGEKYLQKLNEVARLQPDDIRGQESSRLQLEYALSTLQPEPEPPAGGMPTEAPEACRFQCQHCHNKYDSLTSVKKHMAISHKVKFTQCVVFDPARHATGNLPPVTISLTPGMRSNSIFSDSIARY